MLGKETVRGWVREREDQYFSSLVCLVCLTLMSDGRKAQGEWRGGYLGWHEQLLTEKQDPPVTIATLVLPTLVCLCLQLICAILILLKKELPG